MQINSHDYDMQSQTQRNYAEITMNMEKKNDFKPQA